MSSPGLPAETLTIPCRRKFPCVSHAPTKRDFFKPRWLSFREKYGPLLTPYPERGSTGPMSSARFLHSSQGGGQVLDLRGKASFDQKMRVSVYGKCIASKSRFVNWINHFMLKLFQGGLRESFADWARNVSEVDPDVNKAALKYGYAPEEFRPLLSFDLFTADLTSSPSCQIFLVIHIVAAREAFSRRFHKKCMAGVSVRICCDRYSIGAQY